jgi:hypothetical protein
VLPVIWSLWLCKNDKVFDNKILLPCRSFTGALPFMVYSTTSGASRPIYGGLYTVGGCGEGYFFPTWMVA